MSDATETPSPQPPQQEGWMAAASSFISARIELIKLETRDASQEAVKRGALLVVILVGTFLFWLLAVAGLIGWISTSQSWPWFAVAFAIAGIHLLFVVVAGVLLRKPATPSFPLTRAELSKDQAWLETLKNDPKSPN